MAQLQPSLAEVLTASQDYAASNMYTSIPGIVVTVTDLGEQRIDVQPAINLRSQDGGEVSERPPILNVPLQMPISKQGGLTFPISVGTPVTLFFSMRGLDIWKRSNGYPSTPSDMRKFDIRDCVAIPGTYPFSEAPNQPSKRTLGHDPMDVVLVHNIGSGAEVEVRLKTNGDVVINSPTKVIVNCEDAEINAGSSTAINTDSMTIDASDVTVTSGTFVVNTGTYAISATGTATMAASLSQNGSFTLNGIAIESHRHPENDGGGPTDGPIN